MSKPNDLLSYAHGRLGWPIKLGDHVHMTIETQGDDDEGRHHLVPSGTKGVVHTIEWFDFTDQLAITIEIEAGSGRSIINTFADDDPVAFPFIQTSEPKPKARHTYKVIVRGSKFLAQELEIEAANDIEAEKIAISMASEPDFDWDESEPYDFNVEGCTITTDDD